MKLTLKKLVNDTPQLANITHKQGLSRKMSYAIAKNTKKIEHELEVYNSERQKLLDKYCVKDEAGKNKIDENNQLQIPDKNMNNWNKEINELLDIEVEMDIHKFKIDDFYNSECDMSPAELMVIDYMIEE